MVARSERPSSIRVGPYDIKVVEETDAAVNDKYWGSYQVEEMRIGLAPDQKTLVRAADTLLHEVLHAVWHVYHFGKEMADEEKAVTRLSTALIQVFRDNPGFHKWLERNLYA